ncbi:MAG TPA: hypothetical protein VMP08_20165 [Anaerolineae bacterium]|nr:hypothetical protein [Anaerolineae bacterium]
MSTFSSRLYTDLNPLIEFLRVARPTDQVSDYPSATDLREALGRPHVQAATRSADYQVESSKTWFSRPV